MKKTLLWQLLMLLIPLTSIAQTPPPILSDAIEKAERIRSVEMNANEQIFLIDAKNKEIELMDITGQMQIKWRVKIPGHLLNAGKIKNKIAVISFSEKDKGLGYEMILIDPANGAVLQRKTIRSDDQEYEEETKFFFSEDGDDLKVVIRKTEKLRKTGFFDAMKNYYRYDTTKELIVFEIDEALTEKNKLALPVNDGLLFNINVNNKGALFLSWYKDIGTVEVERFERGKSLRAGIIKYPFKVSDKAIFNRVYDLVNVASSKTDPNIIYLALIYKKDQLNTEVSLVRFNFGDLTHLAVIENINKDVLRTFANNYTQFNSNVGKPALGYAIGLEASFMGEENGDLVLAIASTRSWGSTVYSGAGYDEALSPIVSVYGAGLKMKGRQLIPSSIVTLNNNNDMPHVDYHLKDHKLYYIANSSTGTNSFTALYGAIDLNDGKYLQQNYLPKGSIKKPWAMYNSVMWFGGSFIVPYAYFKNGWKKEIVFQLNQY